jgi:histidyl-tRNA synthetase
MKRRFQAVKGTRDILPPETALWNCVEQTARQVFAAYNFHEIRLPCFEETELFARSVGMDTDIVQKEMYSFEDRDSTSISLRPEATASVVRAYLEHGMHTRPAPVKLYYLGPMFRRERPQKGRFRQFYQVGAEVLGGSDAPAIDAEVIELVMVFIERCGLKGCALTINSIGCPACRPKYVELVREELKKVSDRLGPDSQRRIDTNPLRVLDSKVEGEQPVIAELPSILDHLCDACREHFAAVQQELKERNLKFEINHRLVRGLDYYTRTTFEVTAPGLGAQDAVCGGGRYDGLSELLGGPPTKGIGWALGTDRLLLALEAAGARAEEKLDCFIIWLGPGRAPGRALARRLRDHGAAVELLYEEMKLGKALERASRLGARFAVIVGEDEVAKKKFTLRDLKSGTQSLVSEAQLLKELLGVS